MGFKLPDYSVEKMIENTANNPEWIHFGAGIFSVAFPGCSLSAFIKQWYYDYWYCSCRGL